MANILIRDAQKKDIQSIYDICCDVELNEGLMNDSRAGFLLGHYSTHPEFRDLFTEKIGSLPFFVAEYNNQVMGFILGYTQDQWIQERGGLLDASFQFPQWNVAALDTLGINDISSIDYVVCEKVAASVHAKGLGVGNLLVNMLGQVSKAKFQYSEVVEKVYENGVLLPIVNVASKKFHEKIGAIKIADSSPYTYEKSFLGCSGSFVDGCYLLPF